MKKLTALFLALALCLSLCTVTFAAGQTIGGILPDDFPESQNGIVLPVNAWVNEDDDSVKCYCYNNILYFDNNTIPRYFHAFIKSNPVSSDGSNYKISEFNNDFSTMYTVTFYMTEGVLTSIQLANYKDATEDGSEILNGTYYPPVVTHTVTIDDTIQNGKVTATPTDVASGTDVTLTVTPNAGYKTKSVSVTTAGGANVTVTGSGTTYSFVMPNENVTVSAVFEKENSGTGGGHHHGGSTTPTVTSATTADMGVALYGVLTVSSLLGMGWVSKKKH